VIPLSLLKKSKPLLEIKDFGPPTTYGEDKELKLNKESTPLLTSPSERNEELCELQRPLTPPLSLKGRGRRIFDPSPQSSAIRHAVSLDSTLFRRFSNVLRKGTINSFPSGGRLG